LLHGTIIVELICNLKLSAMKNLTYNSILSILFFTGLIIFPGCDKKMILDSGYLEGTVSIGPICPVQTDPPAPGCLPTAETYKAYPVSIWTANGRVKIKQITPSLDGTYRVELIPGNYRVILENDQLRIGSSNLPVDVSITTLEKTLLDINIDTGIR
jgi:hypothetical protein